MVDAALPTPIATTAECLSVAEILSPRSVAVVGASKDVGKFGGRVLHHLVRQGYGGRIVPVNPRRPALFGIPTSSDIAAAGPVDVAVIALTAETCVAACAAAGVGAAVLITSQLARSVATAPNASGGKDLTASST